MTYCVALNKTLNLIYEMGTTITASGTIVRNKGHTYGKVLCKLQRAIEIFTTLISYNVTSILMSNG